MQLNSAQKEAVEYLDGPLLVLAGPGTGKTQLLSSKVAYILENTDTNPENILCLTFTENGAQNMRDRLFSIIKQDAAKVNIHTYHAFGSTILADYKNYAESYDRNLDSAIDTVTQFKIIKKIQENLSGNDILRGDKITDIISTIASAKDARLTPDDLEKIAKDNIETSEKMLPELNEYLENLVPRMKFEKAIEEVYGPMLEIFAKYSKKEPLAGNIEREANVYLFELNRIIEDERVKEKPSVAPLTKWKNQRFEKDANDKFRLKNIIANKKLKSLANIMREYNKYLEKESLYDFSDMIEEAIKALKNDAGFRLTLSERFQYILLDEFQDTNTSQAELIYLLTDYEKPNIMAVGDDDQAIFAFQGANASNLIEFQQHYDAKVITLTENYRSIPEILDFSHKIADKIEGSFAKSRGIEKILTARGIFKKKEISRDEFVAADSEYYWVAEKIDDLINSGVDQKDIAVIAPKHKYIAPLLPYLKAHKNVHIAYEKRDNIFEEPKINELLKLSRFVYDLSQEKRPNFRMLEILSFPFWEIPPIAAIKACTNISADQKTTLEHLENSENENIKNAAEFIAELVQKSYEAPLELFLNEIIKKWAKYYEKNSSEYDTFELYEQLAVLREALKSHIKTEKPLLKDLIDFLDDYEEAEQALVNTSPYEDSSDAVQILTAHKSKGLEFEYVFLVATDNLAWGKGKGNNSFLTLPPNLVEIRHTGITDDERLRLFFVAATRAKSHLYITNSIEDFSGKKPGRLEYLGEYEDEETDKIISPYLGLNVKTHYDDLDEAKKQTDLELNWIEKYQKLTPDLTAILKARLENYRMSATDLTSFIDLTYAGPQAFYENKLLRLPPEPATAPIIFGNLIHATFEQITNRGISDDEAAEFYRTQAALQPVSTEDLKYLLERGEAAISASLKTFAKIIRNKSGRAEVNLSHENLMFENVPVLGVIDHIDINEDEKTIEVYDFKTGKYKDKKWDSDATLYKYRLQLGFYKLLLNLSPTYTKYKVEKAHILFVSPDPADDMVYDKVYEYNEKDEAELKALIKATYKEIISLDFMKNPEIFLRTDEGKNLTDIKNFVAKLIEL
ncbi:ATP-dependent helicase [Candidatus Saccharibacteria bacterium]|nr:ATP-dependent helicase [Candidatus Saccharibacteria bacterium]